MRQKTRFVLYMFSIFCAYPFFDAIEANTLEKRKVLEIRLNANTIDPFQDYPDFVQIKSSSAKKVYKNEQGFWETEFEYGLIMVYIPSGEFRMGSDADKKNFESSRSVYLEGYWIGKYEVTFDQYDHYCSERGIKKPDDEGWGREGYPVLNVSWTDAMAYCRWLSEKIGCDFTLPTEAQWEKASRGTDGRMFPWGDSPPSDRKANFNERNKKSLKQTAPVGSYPDGASPYGVLDMAGNVYEWCLDWYGTSHKSFSPNKDSHGRKRGNYRVLRGGSWYGSSLCLRTMFRTSAKPDSRYFHIGFRICLN